MTVRGQQVIDIIVKALEGKTGTHLISLGSVVENHIQDDLHAVIVQGLDQEL